MNTKLEKQVATLLAALAALVAVAAGAAVFATQTPADAYELRTVQVVGTYDDMLAIEVDGQVLPVRQGWVDIVTVDGTTSHQMWFADGQLRGQGPNSTFEDALMSGMLGILAGLIAFVVLMALVADPLLARWQHVRRGRHLHAI